MRAEFGGWGPKDGPAVGGVSGTLGSLGLDERSGLGGISLIALRKVLFHFSVRLKKTSCQKVNRRAFDGSMATFTI